MYHKLLITVYGLKNLEKKVAIFRQINIFGAAEIEKSLKAHTNCYTCC